MSTSSIERNFIHPLYHADEIWIPVEKEFKFLQPWYMISNYGKIYSKVSDKLMKLDLLNSGYYKVTLRTLTNEAIDITIHRLVLVSFNPVEGYENLQVNHIDGNKLNNCLNNLEWVNNSENLIHAYEHNLRKSGTEHMWAKFSEEQVRKICSCLENGDSLKDICEKVNIEYNRANTSSIYLIKTHKNWKSISKDYKY